MPEWSRNGMNSAATYRGHRLSTIATKGAGTGYGGWYGYVNGEYVCGSDIESDVKERLVESVDLIPMRPKREPTQLTIVPHRRFQRRR